MAKKGSKKSIAAHAAGNFLRRRKATRLQKRKYDKRTTKTYSPIPTGFQLVGQTFAVFKKFWKPLGGIALVYIILSIFFASGFSNIGSSFEDIKLDLQSEGRWHLPEAVGGFGSLLSNAGLTSSEADSVMQIALFIIVSLVIIWALRHLLAGQAIKIKQAFYSAMSPLIQFVLIVFVIILQLLPITLGSFIVAAITSSIFSSTVTAVAVMTILIVSFAIWSIYMLSSSIFALYIVTLPEMEPLKALRSAKNLVRFRRWSVIRKVVFLPVFIVLVMGIIIIPLILYADVLVTAVFFGLSILTVFFAHIYLYSLYRGLLE